MHKFTQYFRYIEGKRIFLLLRRRNDNQGMLLAGNFHPLTLPTYRWGQTSQQEKVPPPAPVSPQARGTRGSCCS